MFVHFVNAEDEQMWTDDHDPPRPTRTWKPGETIQYTRTVFVPSYPYNGRATIVGQPTFGKNTVQIWNDLPNGGGLRLTTDRWFTPNHNSVAPDGVQPDVLVEGPEDPASDEDPQLERAVEILRGS